MEEWEVCGKSDSTILMDPLQGSNGLQPMIGPEKGRKSGRKGQETRSKEIV
jgi:hypothetical protein